MARQQPRQGHPAWKPSPAAHQRIIHARPRFTGRIMHGAADFAWPSARSLPMTVSPHQDLPVFQPRQVLLIAPATMLLQNANERTSAFESASAIQQRFIDPHPCLVIRIEHRSRPKRRPIAGSFAMKISPAKNLKDMKWRLRGHAGIVLLASRSRAGRLSTLNKCYAVPQRRAKSRASSRIYGIVSALFWEYPVEFSPAARIGAIMVDG